MTVVLQGPVLLPGDDEPVIGADVKVRLVAGGARTPGFVDGTARQGEWSTSTDDDGQFSVTVPALPDDATNFPSSDFYLVSVGGGRHPVYQVKVKPTTDGSWVYTDPEIRVYTDVPPDVVFAAPQVSDAQTSAAVTAYLDANPVDVSAEVDAFFAADPPLFAAQNGADVPDPAAFLDALGGASTGDVSDASAAIRADLNPMLLKESTEPAVRSDTPNMKLQLVSGSLYVVIDS